MTACVLAKVDPGLAGVGWLPPEAAPSAPIFSPLPPGGFETSTSLLPQALQAKVWLCLSPVSKTYVVYPEQLSYCGMSAQQEETGAFCFSGSCCGGERNRF